MEIKIQIERLRRLKGLLREALLLISSVEGSQHAQRLNQLFQDICNIVFTDDFYLDLWDESALNQLSKFFETKAPNPKIYGQELILTKERKDFVQKINELFYSILNNSESVKDVCKKLSKLMTLDESIELKLAASGHLENIRSANDFPSEKISGFFTHLKQDLGLSFDPIDKEIENVLFHLKAQETYGKVNALMVNTSTGGGILIPLSLSLELGSGNVNCLVSGCDDFKTAIERTKYAMISNGFLSQSDDIFYSLEITEAEYSGDSIGLAAAIVMYSAKMKQSIDPFTAFTGNVNLDGSRYKVTAVKGINSKLHAALLNGCKRVFVPVENQAEVSSDLNDRLQIRYISEITDAPHRHHLAYFSRNCFQFITSIFPSL